MSKRAEERALESYPIYTPKDINRRDRNIFQQGYERAEKDMGWISVEDEFPKTPEYVITCVKMNGIPQSVGFHYYLHGKWWEGFKGEYDGAIEYWMPIPKF